MSDAVASQRRVYSGASAFRLSDDGEEVLVGGMVAEVPGRQTVPRAELWGAALLANAAPSSGPFEITLDAAYVVNGLSRRGERFRGANGDLWTILARIIDDRAGETSISKVKSHVLEEQLEQVAARQHCWRHVVGNELADAAADTGPALFSQDVGAASRRARHIEDKAAAIAHRLARIQARIWESSRGAAVFEPPPPISLDPIEKEPEHAARDIISTVNAKGHHLEGWNSGFRCLRCGIKRGWKNRGYFTSTKCKPNLPAQEVVKRLRTRPPIDPQEPPSPADQSFPADLAAAPSVTHRHDDHPDPVGAVPECPTARPDAPSGADASLKALTPRQEERDTRRKRRRGLGDDAGRPPGARAAHARKKDCGQTGEDEFGDCVVDGDYRHVDDLGAACSLDNPTAMPKEADEDESPLLLAPIDAVCKSDVSKGPADADEGVHIPSSCFFGDVVRARAIDSTPFEGKADRICVKEQDHGFKVSCDDTIKGEVDELYDQNSEDHIGNYTADHISSIGIHEWDTVFHKHATVLDDDAPHEARGGPPSASYPQGVHHHDGDPEDYHDPYGLQEGANHPFDCPPEEGELYSLHGGDDQPRTSGATSSGDPCPATVQCDARSSPLRRRLTGKTSPSRAAELGHAPRAGDPPPGHELVTREAARAARLRLREATETHNRYAKKARYAAWQAIRRQPELFSSSHDGEPVDRATADLREAHDVDADDGHIPLRWRAHASHDVAAAPGAQLVYCRRCGSWSIGERSANLTRACSLKQGHKGNLRLLSLGIIPRRGARVPAELKRAGSRGSRGGLVVRRSKRRGSR